MTNDFEKKYQEHYERLNQAQMDAVDSIFGPVMVVAGPGSGKTQLLSMRVANILRQTDALPNSILCLTFTDSAANNMRTRLANLIDRDAFKVSIHTFHSLGTEIITQNPNYFYFGAGYRPSDDLSQVLTIRSIFQELDRKNPLASFHEELDYTYLRDTIACIEALKRGGITPLDFKSVLIQNQNFLNKFDSKLQEIFEDRVGVKTVENLWKFKQEVELYYEENSGNLLNNSQENPVWSWTNVYSGFKEFVLLQIEQAFIQTSLLSQNSKVSTKPVTAWKKELTTKDGKNITHFKDMLKMEKLLALSDIYENYQSKMHKNGLFDFTDMLLEVVKAFEDPEKLDLKYNLQEKYQYILVDEFQDTNGVQMRLLENLLDSPQNEGSPNILTVGDDDQAIYKFQGANIENLLKFREKYPSTKIIVLQKNYRSNQEILDLAMKIAEQSTERLRIEGMEKTLESAR